MGCKRHQVLLDGLRAGPLPDEVQTDSLVVGATGSGAPERLLAYHRARALVVKVHVASTVSEDLVCLVQDGPGD